MLGSTKITLGRRRSAPKKRVLMLVAVALLLFLGLWQMPLKQRGVLQGVPLPAPRETR